MFLMDESSLKFWEKSPEEPSEEQHASHKNDVEASAGTVA